jgi:heme/copper-type cytochrome/quinol oxidase subunit 3
LIQFIIGSNPIILDFISLVYFNYKMNIYKSEYTQRHAFHLVDPSILPFITAISALCLTLGSVLFFHGYVGGIESTFFGLSGVLLCMFLWWRDVVRESTLEGHHTDIVQLGLRYGMLLFIVSEIMFFFAFFWAFFAAALAPVIEIGSIWPPKGIDVFDPIEVPLLNTLLLLTSGATVTYAHHAITCGSKIDAVFGLILTVVLAILFTCLQAFEYVSATFTISDGIYGSTFYMATGFHGFHVLIGTIFLFVCLIRLSLDHFTIQHHFGFEAAAFYWHFVDVVWLFLYIAVYFWGGN